MIYLICLSFLVFSGLVFIPVDLYLYSAPSFYSLVVQTSLLFTVFALGTHNFLTNKQRQVLSWITGLALVVLAFAHTRLIPEIAGSSVLFISIAIVYHIFFFLLGEHLSRFLEQSDQMFRGWGWLLLGLLFQAGAVFVFTGWVGDRWLLLGQGLAILALPSLQKNPFGFMDFHTNLQDGPSHLVSFLYGMVGGFFGLIAVAICHNFLFISGWQWGELVVLLTLVSSFLFVFVHLSPFIGLSLRPTDLMGVGMGLLIATAFAVPEIHAPEWLSQGELSSPAAMPLFGLALLVGFALLCSSWFLKKKATLAPYLSLPTGLIGMAVGLWFYVLVVAHLPYAWQVTILIGFASLMLLFWGERRWRFVPVIAFLGLGVLQNIYPISNFLERVAPESKFVQFGHGISSIWVAKGPEGLKIWRRGNLFTPNQGQRLQFRFLLKEHLNSNHQRVLMLGVNDPTFLAEVTDHLSWRAGNEQGLTVVDPFGYWHSQSSRKQWEHLLGVRFPFLQTQFQSSSLLKFVTQAEEQGAAYDSVILNLPPRLLANPRSVSTMIALLQGILSESANLILPWNLESSVESVVESAEWKAESTLVPEIGRWQFLVLSQLRAKPALANLATLRGELFSFAWQQPSGQEAVTADFSTEQAQEWVEKAYTSPSLGLGLASLSVGWPVFLLQAQATSEHLQSSLVRSLELLGKHWEIKDWYPAFVSAEKGMGMSDVKSPLASEKGSSVAETVFGAHPGVGATSSELSKSKGHYSLLLDKDSSLFPDLSALGDASFFKAGARAVMVFEEDYFNGDDFQKHLQGMVKERGMTVEAERTLAKDFNVNELSQWLETQDLKWEDVVFLGISDVQTRKKVLEVPELRALQKVVFWDPSLPVTADNTTDIPKRYWEVVFWHPYFNYRERSANGCQFSQEHRQRYGEDPSLLSALMALGLYKDLDRRNRKVPPSGDQIMWANKGTSLATASLFHRDYLGQKVVHLSSDVKGLCKGFWQQNWAYKAKFKRRSVSLESTK